MKDHLAVQAEPVLRRLEQFAPDFLVEAGRRAVQHAGPAPRSPFPLAGSGESLDDEVIGCGSAVAEEELIQLSPNSR